MTPRLSLTLDEILSIDGNRPAYEALISALRELSARNLFASNPTFRPDHNFGAFDAAGVRASADRPGFLVSGIVEGVNRRLSSAEQVERFAGLERDFEAERGEVTPTLKVRREVVARDFAGALEGLYANPAGDF